ncbi:MAG: hypothetical protein HY718_15815 [Planctomycetes bacterium]|nr:hypothetical protein [Planctomycetota bacterium]
MNPVDPAELSALLDGELTPSRAAEVRAAVDADPALRAEFDQLQALDAACRSAAATATFPPQVAVPAAHPSWSWTAIGVAAVLLLIVRLAPKLLDLAAAGVLLNAAALAVAVVWLVRLTRGHERYGVSRAVERSQSQPMFGSS